MEKISNKISEAEMLNAILIEIREIKEKIDYPNSQTVIIPEWIPRADVMKYLGYGDTQIREFEVCHKVISSKIGNRKFFNRLSLIEVLEKNIETAPDS